MVESAWSPKVDGLNPLQNTWSSLTSLAGSMIKWSKVSFGSVRKEIAKFERRLKVLRNTPVDAATVAEERRVEKQLCELFEREEIMARQRSRVEWLREGDRNTAFFHAKASARKKTNQIKALVKED